MTRLRFKIVLIAGLLIGQTSCAYELIDQEKLANAIYLAEGGLKAKVPYGILSVKVKDEKEARQVCLNTINNNLARWQWAKQNGDKMDFIQFLGDRYCPIGAGNDPKNLNSNWVRNVKSLYLSDSNIQTT